MTYNPIWKQEGEYEYDAERFSSLRDAMEYAGRKYPYDEDEEMIDEDCIIEE